jgi:hypothetical protein
MGEYSSVMERPTADAAGGGSSAAGWSAAFESMPYSPFSHPFAGWIALSNLISDSNPELADAMRVLATILQAAIEQMTVELFPEIRSLLAQAGIPRWCVEDAERTLLSGLLPLSVEELAEQASEAFAELKETGTVEPTEPAESGFLASIIHYGGHAILGTEIEGIDTRPPQFPVRREDLPEGFLDHFLPSSGFRTVASLDLPGVVSGRGFSIWCRKPLRRRGDCLEATEHTYIERDVLGLSNTRFRGDSVLEKYRDDIDDWLPGNFSESMSIIQNSALTSNGSLFRTSR